ncbi:MAG: inorganic phosphate transporter, partial [Verrucomicrobiota bacterium]|nr:inorganic phosphate transporter [Verrucomicrobiota bacterium]
MFFSLLGGLFLGWSLGANDSANIFGTAVSSRMIKYSTAVILITIFVILGACLQGAAGIETLSKVSNQTIFTATIVSFSAALTVTVMTVLKIPVSTSQAVGGAIFGIGFLKNEINYKIFTKMIICWVATPFGAVFISIILYFLFKKILDKWQPDIFTYDPVVRIGLIICGSYGAYSLGANNTANVAAVFVGEHANFSISPFFAAVLGGIGIAIGAITYSKPVMMTVGKGIVKMDAFSAFISILSLSITLHLFAGIGVPVSSSQAIVGSVLGISFVKGLHVINFKTLRNVFSGWAATPFIAALMAILLFNIFS